MARPSKSHLQLVGEGKSHISKKELKFREKAEKSLLTNIEIKEFKETKKNKIAHKEFKRIIELLGVIEKNDDLFAGVLNRYCILKAECTDFEVKREEFYNSLSKLEEEYEFQRGQPKEEQEISLFDYFKLRSQMQGQIVALDKQIMNKRKMMLDIEKENLMTVASALRCIPKKPVENKEESNDPFDALFDMN